MKKWIGLITGLLLTWAVSAQAGGLPVDLSWSAADRLPSGTELNALVLAPGGGFYLLYDKERAFLSRERAYLDYYDTDLRRQRSRKLELRGGGHRYESYDLLILRGRLYWLLTETEKRSDSKSLYVQALDPQRLDPRGTPRLIGQTVALSRRREGAFDLVFSPDSARILLYNQLPYARNIPERFDLRVYDDDFQLLWQREIELPFADELFRVQEYRIDARGNVFLLGKLFTSDRRRYGFVVLAYLQEGTEVREYALSPERYAISHLTFRVGRDGRLVCAGFYTMPGENRARGTCYFRLNPLTGERTDFNFQGFNFDFINEFMTEERREEVKEETRSGNRRGPRLRAYTLDELVLRTDGGALLVAEQRYVEDFAFPHLNGTMQVDYLYHFNDVVIVNIRPDGSVEWAARIPKRQVTRNDRGAFSSYAMAIVRDRLFFVFNDNRFNYETGRRTNKLYTFHNRTPLMAITEVNKDGNLRTFPLLQGSEPGLTLRPRECRQSGLREMILYGEGRRSYQLGRLQF